MRRVKPLLSLWMKRWLVVEPVTRHMKNREQLHKNYLRGQEDDPIKGTLGEGHNIRKLLRVP